MVMAPKQPNSGLFVGLKKGHVVTPKELAPRPSDRKGSPRDMTGNTGTLDYMAPEVLDGKPYIRKCDVYSFGNNETFHVPLPQYYFHLIDIRSVGCLFAEMVVEKYVPIGGTANTAVMSKITSVFGKPNEKDWPGVAAALKLYGMEEQVISSLLK
ncbi:60S ribosomal protein l36 [Phtheirospermum japonicum]|uniref:60S ribosomal protein l36 n=1 Tax=Phtheirospermum japonicum TaxID=374723 RepID=A0A830CSP0_9LAMI|nr:60S ribosomal protein l36 [Phtheirospermum japonicum]